MALKKNHFEITDARNELVSLIDGFIELSVGDELRPKVKALIPAFHILRKFGMSIIDSEAKNSARDRIRIYFNRYPLTIIDSEELLVVSGITDYQRRIRELRVQFGWPIVGGATAKQMYAEGDWSANSVDVSKIKPDQYVMLDSGQDKEAAHRWNVINSLRRENISVKDKLLAFFKDNIGREITGEELRYLAKDAKEWARRTRELRTEDGWPIKTRNSGRPDLPVGVYILEENRQAEVHDRKIDDETRVAVLDRDQLSCRKCGWSYSQRQSGDPRQFLELHHLDYHADKGANSVTNLLTICNVHHDEVHKKHMTKDEVLKWIKSQVL
jgi:hypothetical protein